MEVSPKLAIEFNTILLSHTFTLLLLVLFSAYIFYRAKKSPLLYSYLSVVGMIGLWIIAKILKTVSPLISLRWFFIVIQYFAIDSLGVCLLIFAYIYRTDRLPSKKLLLAWVILPAISFLVLVTNPMHMTFYSYFDIYKDRFGLAFYFAQSIQYFYLLTGILMLSRGFTKQPCFVGKRGLGNLFAVFVLLPILANTYYILFKMNLLPWVLGFPVFDFTPIAASISLMLFIIPTLTFRFFDVSPVSLARLYDIVPQGIAFVDEKLNLYGENQTFFSMLNLNQKPLSLTQLFSCSDDLDSKNKNLLLDFIAEPLHQEAEISLADGRCIKFMKHYFKKGHMLLYLKDVTQINCNRFLLAEQNLALEQINSRLNSMADTTKALVVARTKSQMAQNVHDILGHSLTVVIGTAELAAAEDIHSAMQKVKQIEELLTGSLNDLRNAFSGAGAKWGETTLIKALQHLKNENILVEIQIQGKTYELSGEQTEAIYRLCQEAVTNAIKHGKAKAIYLILRYHPQEIEIYAMDNGCGCQSIQKNYGLCGIEARVTKLLGSVSFSSDGESGFSIHVKLPRQDRYELRKQIVLCDQKSR